ncbi:MAG: MEKHLA domain-containing protein [Gloeomargarita sp. SKYG116]|nr:MEKHLA domain-containing protein [Gloeomargarita sp. SKYG116]MDW8400068.1 MEKHLA domain-containing protein [Gloeomargarita sp. SKYGB_i_bin116]
MSGISPWQRPDVQTHSQRLISSFRHWTGQRLMDASLDLEALAYGLFHAPWVLVSHDTQPDPCFNYGNQAALDLWETTWDQWIGLPSRLSAADEYQPERAQLLQQVKTQGWAQGYRGVRISRKGRRFQFQNAIVWNVLDDQGQFYGQAAMFREWTWLD